MDVYNLLYIIFITLLPTLELRASIPYALLVFKLNPIFTFFFVVLINILLGELIFYLLNTFLPYVLKIKFLEKIYKKCVERVQKKAYKYVNKYGTIGLALFIGVPLPGSGVWTGALAAFLFGFKKKEFSRANIIGVIIAGILVSLITLFGINSFSFL
ncbi:MAG: ligand-binding protein SH3 [Candidatus Aenigmatarchaeota archaeon]|nr:MAG: ligand-binding protein SH3 [Candidatus Aenigmarchaeota archaeon]